MLVIQVDTEGLLCSTTGLLTSGDIACFPDVSRFSTKKFNNLLYCMEIHFMISDSQGWFSTAANTPPVFTRTRPLPKRRRAKCQLHIPSHFSPPCPSAHIHHQLPHLSPITTPHSPAPATKPPHLSPPPPTPRRFKTR